MTSPTTEPCPERKCALPEHDSDTWHAQPQPDGTFERWRSCGHKSEYEELRTELADLRTKQFEMLIQNINSCDPRLMEALRRAARISGANPLHR